MRRLSCSTLLAIFALATVLAGRSFATAFGTLSNFDVVNDTPGDCHGFEIELEDLRPSDVPYTFGGSYTRYGAPEVLDTTVDPAHPRVLVRYRHSSFDPSAVPGRLHFDLRFDRLALTGPFTSELTVTITTDPPVATHGLDRVGTIADCRTTTNAMFCLAD